MSASPHAMRAPLMPAPPHSVTRRAPRRATASLERSDWRERDTSTSASASAARLETRIGARVPSAITSKAPSPSPPIQVRPSAGATSTPSVARPPSDRPIITANSPFRATNSRVPSSGSTNHTRGSVAKPANVAGSLSSATMGTPG